MASGTGDLNYKRAHVFYALADLLSCRFRAVYKLKQIRKGAITYWLNKLAPTHCVYLPLHDLLIISTKSKFVYEKWEKPLISHLISVLVRRHAGARAFKDALCFYSLLIYVNGTWFADRIIWEERVDNELCDLATSTEKPPLSDNVTAKQHKWVLILFY